MDIMKGKKCCEVIKESGALCSLAEIPCPLAVLAESPGLEGKPQSTY